ncbi:MAG: hypothetical protein K2Z80_32150 [Xanthobacteraceae bacterium]|nr:hypothetical protein [Xanthobacteraceae bacterium]
MAVTRIASNVVSYDPESDLKKIDPARLRTNQWPEELVKCFEQTRFGSEALQRYESKLLGPDPDKPV